MTVPSAVSSVTGTGNGVTTVWTFPFKLDAAADLEVILTEIATGNETMLASNLYSIAGLGVAGGGSITYPLAGDPLAATHKITRRRTVPIEQLTDLVNQGPWLPDVVENALDRTAYRLAMLWERLGRVLAFPAADGGGVTKLPGKEQRANKFLGFNADGNPVPVASSGEIPLATVTVEDDDRPVTGADHNTILRWAGAAGVHATWPLSGSAPVGTLVFLLRSSDGNLKTSLGVGATRRCRLDQPGFEHNGVDLPAGLMWCLVETNTDGSSAAWLIGGDTAIVA